MNTTGQGLFTSSGARFSRCGLYRYRLWRTWRPGPAAMLAFPDPIGTGNNLAIVRALNPADLVICAWGAYGGHLNRGPAVARLIKRYGLVPHHLGLTRGGHPRHPLYLPYDQQPVPWEVDA